MVLAMTIIGAITRLTESGLSITEWNVVMGAIPPLNEHAWLIEFEKYKQTPEFAHKHFWMNVDDFKKIFFWEWLHRLWGRLIGAAYAVPLCIFWIQGYIPSQYKPSLLLLLLLGAAQGFMGWYMVQSGLIDRPAVSHFRLAAHLSLALIIYTLLLWNGLSLYKMSLNKTSSTKAPRSLQIHGIGCLILIAATIIWGAFVAGLDAGLIYNQFPFMGKSLIPPDMWQLQPAWLNIIKNHAAVQFTHRWLAITTTIITLFYAIRGIKIMPEKNIFWLLAFIIIIQLGLGIATLLTQVNIIFAASHQAGAVALLTIITATLHKILRKI